MQLPLYRLNATNTINYNMQLKPTAVLQSQSRHTATCANINCTPIIAQFYQILRPIFNDAKYKELTKSYQDSLVEHEAITLPADFFKQVVFKYYVAVVVYAFCVLCLLLKCAVV